MPTGTCPDCLAERLIIGGKIDLHFTRDADGCLDTCDGVGLPPLTPRNLAGGPAIVEQGEVDTQPKRRPS